MKKAIWIAGYGPDRSHDTLYSETFEREKDAKAFVAGQGCWRISRMEYTQPYSPGERTDEIGGVDVDKEIERIRRVEQCRTGRRVSTKQALALWQKSMRSGPGGARKNPARKKKTTKRQEAVPIGQMYRKQDLNIAERVILDLAVAIHRRRSKASAVSWKAQVEADAYFRKHGLEKTMDKVVELGGPVL